MNEFKSAKKRKKIQTIQIELTKFDEILPELISLIFKNLNLNDLLNCRLINKKYKDFADEAIRNIDNLIVLDLDYFKLYFLIPTWFGDNKSINYDDAITFNKFEFYKSFISKFQIYKLANNLQSNLRRLTIGLRVKEFGCQINLSPLINCFTNLEQLQILDSDAYIDLIDLANLITLNIGLNHCELQLKTPKLRSLKANDLEDLKFNYPHSIKYLELFECKEGETKLFNDFRSFEHKQGKIELFTNLESFSIVNFDSLNTDGLLDKLKKLRKLIININWSFYDNIENLESMKSKFNEIHQHKLKLRRDNLEIYLQGILIKNPDQYEWPSSHDDEIKISDLEFQMKNYDKFGDCIYCCEEYSLDYCYLLELVDKIPSDIHRKFFFTESVKIANKIEDEDQLLLFLFKLPCLVKLNFEYNQTFSQSFYDNLIKLSKLNHLELNEEDDYMKLIDYDFLFKIKYLCRFATKNSNNQLTIDLSIESFKQLKRLEFFKLNMDDLNIHITKNDTFNLFIFKNNYDLIFSKERINFSKLIELLIKIKNDQFKIDINSLKIG